MRLQHAFARLGCLAFYGSKCSCCGEMLDAFLLLVDSKNRAVTNNEYLVLRKSCAPGYVTICANCHRAKRLYGSCPHSAGWRTTPSGVQKVT